MRGFLLNFGLLQQILLNRMARMTAKVLPVDGKKKCSNVSCSNPNKDASGMMLLSEFSVAKDKISGYSSRCRECGKETRNEKAKNNPGLGREKYLRDKVLRPLRTKIKVDSKKCGNAKCVNHSKFLDGTLPASEFGKDNARKTGLTSSCKECMSKEGAEYRKNNVDKEKARHTKYTKENLEALRIKSIKYTARFPEKKKKSRDSWKSKNPKYFNVYIKERKKHDIDFKLRSNLRNRLTVSLRSYRITRQISAVRDLGCTIPEFIAYIESMWANGMYWENYGLGMDKWNLDHIVPLSAFSLNELEQQKKAVHYTNLQPLWQKDNLKKSASLDWKHP